MSGPRLVRISPRFWPLIGGSEVMLTRLATAAQGCGASVTVVTAHWQPDWPHEFDHGGVRVVRLRPPGGSWLSQARYLRSIARWLRSHRQDFDVVIVAGLRHEAYAALGAARGGKFPVVLRAQGFGPRGDCHWQLEARCGSRIKKRCYRAAALIAPCRSVERELIAAGYPRGRIHLVPDGVPIPPPRTDAERQEARQALAESEPTLVVDPDQPVAVYVGRLAAGKGLDKLLESWRAVADRHPTARLWLVGDGPEREQLTASLRTKGLMGKVTLSGAFDNVDDFWRGSDLFILPGAEHTASLALREAMAWGLPVVAMSTEENRSIVDDGRHGRLVPAGNASALAAAVNELWNDPAQAARLGIAARERIAAEYDMASQVQRYLNLLGEVMEASRREG